MTSDLYGNQWQDLEVDSKQLIEQAINKLTDDAGAVLEPNIIVAFKLLYNEDPASYNRYRQQIKASKQVPMTLFDKLTQETEPAFNSNQTIKTIDNSAFSLFYPIEVWEHPVNGEQLLNEIRDTLTQYVIADEPTIIAASLWVVFTWFIEVVTYAPIANITAPEKRCGKTRLLSVLKRLSYQGFTTSNISAAALFRIIERYQPTLLIDEVDTFIDLHDDMRAIINAGFSRESAHIIRCTGEDLEPTPFNVWGAKALCGIGKIADTLQDRSIPLKLRRKHSNETILNVDRSDPEQWAIFRAKLARFAQDNKAKVLLTNPEPIPQLNDRANDCWHPLLQISTLAGGHWLETTRKTALHLQGQDEEPASTRTELLQDIKNIFDTGPIERIFSHELVNALNADNEANWCMWNKGKGLTARNLAKILKEFDIVSNTLRIGTSQRAKGYTKDQFKDAFNRYLTTTEADTPITSVTAGQPENNKDYSQNNNRDINQMSRIEKSLQIESNNTCHVVTDKQPPIAGGGIDTNAKEPNNTPNATHAINELLEDDLDLTDQQEAF